MFLIELCGTEEEYHQAVIHTGRTNNKQYKTIYMFAVFIVVVIQSI